LWRLRPSLDRRGGEQRLHVLASSTELRVATISGGQTVKRTPRNGAWYAKSMSNVLARA
jgi:hypothetical protein